MAEEHITSVPVENEYDENQIQVLEGLEAVPQNRDGIGVFRRFCPCGAKC